jgi:hypothetical protein
MTEEEVERLDLDIERLTFLNDCRTKLDLIRHGYIRDSKGRRATELEALIERHAHVSWLDPSLHVVSHHRVQRDFSPMK